MASILVEILGNAKQFKSELDGAVASTEKANSGFSKMQKVAGVAGLAIAGGLAVGLDKSINAAEEAQASTARLNAAFAASHVSAKLMASGVEEAETKSRQLGFTNDSVKNSLGSLVIATHDGHKAITDLGVAEDIARFKHISLEAASKTLTMAMAGSTRATKQLGIDVPKVTTAQDALKASGSQLKSEIVQQEAVVLKLRDAHDKSTAGVKALKDAQETLSIEQQHAREVTLSHTSATYLAEVAHAKLQDRLSTENAVIATVSEKLHGQADAYSKTAEGGMAQFHAQINNLEEGLGKALLPVITSVSQKVAEMAKFFSDHTQVTKLLVVGLGALAAILLTVSAATKIVAAAQTIASAATKVWAAGQWLLNAALDANPIGIVVIAIAALAAGLVIAYQRSSTFRQIVTGALDDVKSAASSVADFFTKSLPAAFNAVIGWVRSNWPVIAVLISGPFAPLVALATNAFGIRSALTGAFSSILSAASRTVSSIVSFFSNLPGRIVSTLGDVGSLLVNAGEKIMQGLLDGLTSGFHKVTGFVSSVGNTISSLKGPITADAVLLTPHGHAIMDGLHKGLQEGMAQIEAWLTTQTALPNAMSQSLQNAVQAGQRVIQAAQGTFQTAWQQLASDADTAFRGITGAIQTPAEKTLAALQSAHDQAQRTQALTDAQTQLTTAQAGGDPAQIAQAQQAVADATYAIQVAALEKQAALQRTQQDARNALQQRHFDAALGALEAHLQKAHSTYAEAHTAILKLFKSFGIHYQNAGTELGTAFITGLKESIQNAAKGAGKLSGTLTDVASGIHVPHAATGGVVSQTGLAVIHQGETITPAGSAGTVNITVNGWVGSDQAIAEKLRNELIRLGRNTTGGVLGGFA